MNNREACNPFLLINFYKARACLGLCFSTNILLHPKPQQGSSHSLRNDHHQVLASLVCWGCDVCVHLMLTASASWIVQK